MPPITIEAAQATLDEAQASVDKAKTILAQVIAQSKVSTLTFPEFAIELRPGEHYGGAVLDEGGCIKHHLVLMAEQPDDMTWQAAMDWAKSIGGELPTRQEQALLFANCKPYLKGSWHWSSQTHESNEGYAWFCFFSGGDQYYDHEVSKFSARAVRRLNP